MVTTSLIELSLRKHLDVCVCIRLCISGAAVAPTPGAANAFLLISLRRAGRDTLRVPDFPKDLDLNGRCDCCATLPLKDFRIASRRSFNSFGIVGAILSEKLGVRFVLLFRFAGFMRAPRARASSKDRYPFRIESASYDSDRRNRAAGASGWHRAYPSRRRCSVAGTKIAVGAFAEPVHHGNARRFFDRAHLEPMREKSPMPRQNEIAIGSPSTPTAPVLAAVVSDPIIAPDKRRAPSPLIRAPGARRRAASAEDDLPTAAVSIFVALRPRRIVAYRAVAVRMRRLVFSSPSSTRSSCQ